MHNVLTPPCPTQRRGQGPASGTWDSWSFVNNPGGEAAGQGSSTGLGGPLRVPCRVRGLGRSDAGVLRHACVSPVGSPLSPSPTEGTRRHRHSPVHHPALLAHSFQSRSVRT